MISVDYPVMPLAFSLEYRLCGMTSEGAQGGVKYNTLKDCFTSQNVTSTTVRVPECKNVIRKKNE